MTRGPIHHQNLALNPFKVFDKDWMLLAAGDFSLKEINCMTVGWGSFGTMWGKPFVMVVVRPTRHTYELLEKYDAFTLSSFPEEQHGKLEYCGSHSGRDGDKIRAAGLTPIKCENVSAPGFAEADLIIECKKIYFDDFKPDHFLAPYISKMYNGDYHRSYFGEVLAISGSEKYRK